MSKFSQIESGWTLTPFQSLAQPPTVVPRPRNVICNPRLITSSDELTSYTLDVSWDAPLTLLGIRESYVTSYLVEFRRGLKGAWGNRQEVFQQYARYENVGSGYFFARVSAVCSANSKRSIWTVSGAGTITTVQSVADSSSANYSYFVTEF